MRVKAIIADDEPLALKLAGNAEGSYLFNGALARYLADTRGWDDKVARLLALMESAPQDEVARKLVLSAVDVIVAEVLAVTEAESSVESNPRWELPPMHVETDYAFLAFDIKGANAAGIDALFIADGVHGEDVEPYTQAHLQTLFASEGVTALAATRALRW